MIVKVQHCKQGGFGFQNRRAFGAKYWTRLSNSLPVLYFSSQTDAWSPCAKNNISKYSNSLSGIYDLTSHGGKKQEKSKFGKFAFYNHSIEKTLRSFSNARYFIHMLLWFRVLYNTVILISYFINLFTIFWSQNLKLLSRPRISSYKDHKKRHICQVNSGTWKKKENVVKIISLKTKMVAMKHFFLQSK